MAHVKKPINLAVEDGSSPMIRLRAITAEEKALFRTPSYEFLLP